ncbi:hypothetical protein B0H16DRAFT_1555966 [Mycena metata]|uniref:Uncharacterized protein n=1 Tax=Mycena metata TaxID=1033252 RepID=A0AAD7INA2_9AGAR|nr:hypothetical protein B0H16DRAFT_1555966 [Mycena metata]
MTLKMLVRPPSILRDFEGPNAGFTRGLAVHRHSLRHQHLLHGLHADPAHDAEGQRRRLAPQQTVRDHQLPATMLGALHRHGPANRQPGHQAHHLRVRRGALHEPQVHHAGPRHEPPLRAHRHARHHLILDLRERARHSSPAAPSPRAHRRTHPVQAPPRPRPRAAQRQHLVEHGGGGGQFGLDSHQPRAGERTSCTDCLIIIYLLCCLLSSAHTTIQMYLHPRLFPVIIH